MLINDNFIVVENANVKTGEFVIDCQLYYLLYKVVYLVDIAYFLHLTLMMKLCMCLYEYIKDRKSIQ